MPAPHCWFESTSPQMSDRFSAWHLEQPKSKMDARFEQNKVSPCCLPHTLEEDLIKLIGPTGALCTGGQGERVLGSCCFDLVDLGGLKLVYQSKPPKVLTSGWKKWKNERGIQKMVSF